MGEPQKTTEIPEETPVTADVLRKVVQGVREGFTADIAAFEQRLMAAIRGESAPVAAAEPAAPGVISLRDLARRSGVVAAQRKAEYEQHRERMDSAYKEFLAACSDAGFAFDHDAYADPEKDGDDCKAITFLQRAIADGERTIPEAIDYAKEAGWLTELTPFQKILSALRERGKRIVRIAKVNGGEEINVHELFEAALAKGEVTTAEDVIAVATEGGWLRDYDPDRVTFGQAMRDKNEAEAERLRNLEGKAGKRPPGNRGRRTRGKGRR